ncbi:DUF1259 domain-containing protein [Virgibacillus oceani]|nr:DUF1259 domain-containing protein [Virgibacillus oceani]
MRDVDYICGPFRKALSEYDENGENVKNRNVDQSICDKFGKILNGKGKVEDNSVCSVKFKRDIPVKFKGKPSTTVFSANVLFESLDEEGNALNIGEIALLQDEVPNFVKEIAGQGIVVGAIHNHWIFTDPIIIYVHFQSIEPPLEFAEKVANAFSTLRIPLV